MRDETLVVLNQLKNLDLSTYPYERAKELIGKLGWYYAELPLRSGATIIRSRLNENKKAFTSKEELTYVSKEKNKTYRRASTPHSTMFYAALEPGSLERDRFYSAQVTCACELLKEWMGDKYVMGRKVITLGYWRVTKDLHLCAVVQNEDFSSSNPTVKLIMDRLTKCIADLEDKKDDVLLVSTFFANEFAKKERNNYDYLLSSVFTERMVNKGMDGVFYPSVCLDGRGFNIAISPLVADSKLELMAVKEASVYKYYGDFLIDYDKVIELVSNQTTFELVPKLENDHHERDKWLRDLGLKSIDDLK
ncbi:MAG TPA: hypothetical protein VIS48_12380 [Candidatus Kryptonia bacterium]